jgi:hypothetical protein
LPALGIALIAPALLIVPVAPVAASTAQTGCVDSPLMEMNSSGVAGSARVCTTSSGVHAEVDASNLSSGNAYTAWFVYFDQPAACASVPCEPPDVLGDDPTGVLGRMDSLVAEPSGSGALAGDVHGLRLSSGSEVHLAIFGHGPANTDDNRLLARQLLTPEEPVLGAPGLGAPAASNHGAPVAVAVFQIP